jgi:hypothetical protein
MTKQSSRRLRISLRALLVLMTILCLWFAKISIEARRQKEAVEWVLKNRGMVEYRESKWLGAEWLRRLLGDDYFRTAIDVRISHQPLSDISPLRSLSDLEELKLISTNIRDIGPLADLEKLRHLQLNINQIEDVSPVSNLHDLEYLDIQRNHVSDISPVRKLKGLVNLDMGMNPLTDISPVAELTMLEAIALHKLEISDYSPLRKAVSLKVINGVSEERIEELRPSLPNLFPSMGNKVGK